MSKNFTSTLSSHWTPLTAKKLDTAIAEVATVIHERAVMLAPRDTGNLVNSGRIRRNGPASYSVAFGGSDGGFAIPYAKRRHYENRKNPQTLHYLERAGDGVKRSSIEQYIRNA